MIENEKTHSTSLSSCSSKENKTKVKGSNTIKLIGELLTDICNDKKQNKKDKLVLIKYFFSKKVPNISISDYIQRLSRYIGDSKETIILTLIYIDRICELHKINLNCNNIHKLILASFATANKYLEDIHYSMHFFSKVGGVSKKEMINLEYEFLKLIDFNLFVNEELYMKYKNNLENLENDDEDII